MGDLSNMLVMVFAGWRQAIDPRADGVGMMRLTERIRREFQGRRGHAVLLYPWDTSPTIPAQAVEALRPRNLVAVAYSYGAGWALPRFAEALHKHCRGSRIDLACLIDPVPRWRFAPLRWISLTRWGAYSVPARVDRVAYWRQVNASPFGRAVMPADEYATLRAEAFGTHAMLRRHRLRHEKASASGAVGHDNIDEREDVHRDILRLIAEQAGYLRSDKPLVGEAPMEAKGA